MTKQFWVNNYFIDVARNQIQHQQQATSLPPKALKVLEVLAARAGDVVSHEELMDIVWENSVVGPNTLQRAIAQLRKAFGDDSKQQAFIKTHAKKGYSLEANVRWESKVQSDNENNSSNTVPEKDTEQQKQQQLRNRLGILASAVLVLLALVFWPTESVLYDHITPLTASDEQEFNGAYSPDGKYLVFNRYMGQCVSHLWAKDLSNNQEERLSVSPGHYSQLSWSSDGSQLAFVLQSNCSNKPELTQQCWQLQTLDFAQAWNGNAKNLLRYDCNEVKTTHPKWLNDGRIALLQYPSGDSKQPDIMIYDAVSDEVSKVPNEPLGRIYSLDYSRSSGLLATVTLETGNRHVLRTLTVTGDIQSEAVIEPEVDYSVYARFPIKFASNGKYLFTDVEGKVYRLELNGELTRVHSEHYSGLWNPSHHPVDNKFAVTYGTKDFDIGYLTVGNGAADIDVFARSTTADTNGKFQPNGQLMSFVSNRSGNQQLWIIDGDKTYQLTQFEQGLKSSLYYWSPDGQSLAVNVNNQLVIVALDGSHNVIHSRIAVTRLMPWTNQHKIFAVDNQTDNHALYSIELATGNVTATNIHNVLLAADIEDGSTIVADRDNEFWLHSNQQIQPLPKLEKKLFGTYLLFKHGLLYGIDAQAQLWRYDIQTNDVTNIKVLNKNINYISDIKGEQILATKFIGGRRELIEFSQR